MNYLKLIFLSFILFVFDTNLQAAPETNARTAILVDFLSDRILYEKDADYKIYPASMTKIMTTIVAFDLIEKGETTLDEEIIISENDTNFKVKLTKALKFSKNFSMFSHFKVLKTLISQ